MIIDKPYFVVFNPTAEDWANSNETTTTAQKDTADKRWWLTKKPGSESYNYEGQGKYTNGPIADIPAIYMGADELAILAATHRYTPMDFIQAATITEFRDSEDSFKEGFLYNLEFAMLQNSSSPANIEIAHTALATTFTALHNFDFDNCYLLLKDAAIGTSFTQDTKNDMIGFTEDYLKKYPR